MELLYNSGFGNEFATEALPGALPVGQNSPQKTPYNLYVEQLNGSAFTAPRSLNKRSWLYRIRPSVVHKPFEMLKSTLFKSTPFDNIPTTPNQLRWSPHPIPSEQTDFIDGIISMAGCGDSSSHSGVAVHIYAINSSMKGRYFYNSDGEMLIIPQMGRLLFRTELGNIMVDSGEICVIPRGIKFAVDSIDGPARGYICENYGSPFRIPDLGPIGANGLANPRDFQTPIAAYEQLDGEFYLLNKFMGNMWQAELRHSPLDIVAWHGNYAPYKYNLAHFNCINSVTFDHPDPSIYTVLTSPTDTPGKANADFVIFPPRWMVAEHTFRPPWFHRNFMNEYMGLINGAYDAKEGGFIPGGSSLHNCMSGHGPDAATYEKAVNAQLEPHYLLNGLAFMVETCFVNRPTEFAMQTGELQKDYFECWQGLKPLFNPNQK